MDKVLKEKIDQVDVVSFDLFDTLIVRACKKPTDVFRLMEKLDGHEGFTKARIEAEQEARKEMQEDGRGEVTLDDIYKKMPQRLQSLCAEEIAWEKRLSQPDPQMKGVYEACREMKKRIILTSDMYLPQSVIENLLEAAGYEGYEKLYLSSTCGCQKASGKLYDLVQKELGDVRILHIGDNAFTDGEMARKAGWDSYVILPLLFREGEIRHAAYFGVLNGYEDKSLIPSLLEGLISLRHASGEHDYWEDFGYQYAGVMALGYVNWLADEFKKAHLHRIYFMMRDGYIFQKLFEKLYPDYESQSIYGSRTMFLLPGMESYDDIRLHITGIHRQGLTPRRCYERLAIDDDALWQAFEASFPDLDRTLHDEEDFAEVDAFFEEHEAKLRTIGQEQRSVLIDYFESIGLFDGPCAIVDVGWKGSMLRGIEKLCKLEGRIVQLEGYYLGTHPSDLSGLSVHTYGMSQGEPQQEKPRQYLLSGYAIMIIEAMFTAPFPSVLEMKHKGDRFLPVCKDPAPGEDACLQAVSSILSGCKALLDDIQKYHLERMFHVPAENTLLPLEYFVEHISRHDEKAIYHLSCYPSTGRDAWRWPISKNVLPTFAVVLTWPGQMSGEREVVLRICKAAEECGYRCFAIDNHGYLLDEKTEVTSKQVPPVDFVISLHYDSPKVLDAFTYFTIWNPPEIPLNVETDDARILGTYLSFDDFLFATHRAGTPLHHLQAMLLQAPRIIEGASLLAPSLPEGGSIEPAIAEIEKPYLFYCGMNWDVLVHGHGRNEGVMKKLDRKGVLRIFGPDEDWGIRPWAGYQCYQRSIPFDGVSILEEISKCGICLALSSDKHRRTGIATNRVFEACAAGAVIIADDNPMVREMFGDAVLYIDYNRNDAEDTCQQILEHYDWILEHREEAQQLAEKAQRLFREKYSLNTYLAQVVHHHADRVETIARDLYAVDDSKTVAVFYVCNTLDIGEAECWAERVLLNVTHQAYPSIVPLIAADARIAGELAGFCERRCASARVIPMPLYDKFEARKMTEGQAIVRLRRQMPHAYFMMTNSDEEWYFDHVTTLVRCLEKHESSSVAYAGQIRIGNGRRDVQNFRKEPGEMLLADGGEFPANHVYPYPGAFLFRASCHAILPDAAFDYLDGREYAAYVYRLVHHAKEHPVFSNRVTIAFPEKFGEPHHEVIPAAMERHYILDLTAYDRPVHHAVAGKVVQGNPVAIAGIGNPNFSQLTQEDIYARFAFPWEAVPAGANIVIYGGGIVGKTYLEQLIRSNYCTIQAICDKHPERTGIQQVPVISLKKLAGLDPSSYDMVIIAIERRDIAKEIREDLEMMGLPMNKVRWIDPAKER